MTEQGGSSARESWYLALLQSMPCTRENAEVASMLTHLSGCAIDADQAVEPDGARAYRAQ